MKQEFLQELKKQKAQSIPIWMMRQAGRYLPEYREVRKQAGDFLSLCYTPELASEVTLQPLRRYNLDAAIIFSDILVVPDALGQNVRFVAGEGPMLDPINSIQQLPDFNPDKFLEFLSPVFEAVQLTHSQLPDNKTLIGFAGAPWTLACYMVQGKGSRDFETVRHLAVTQPSVFAEIIDRLVEAISIYLIEKIKHGAGTIQIFDSWAGVLSANEFQKWVVDPTAKIVKRLKDSYPDTPVIGFPRLAGLNYQSYIEQTGIDCISLDPTVPLHKARQLQNENNIIVQGNLDPLLLLKGGSDMVDQVHSICDELGTGGFIFNLGHGIIKETDPETVTLLVDTVKNYKR